MTATRPACGRGCGSSSSPRRPPGAPPPRTPPACTGSPRTAPCSRPPRRSSWSGSPGPRTASLALLHFLDQRLEPGSIGVGQLHHHLRPHPAGALVDLEQAPKRGVAERDVLDLADVEPARALLREPEQLHHL